MSLILKKTTSNHLRDQQHVHVLYKLRKIIEFEHLFLQQNFLPYLFVAFQQKIES